MKYVSVGIIIVFLALIFGFWLKRTPKVNEMPSQGSQVEEKGQNMLEEKSPVSAETKTNNNKIKIIQGMKIETIKEGTGPEIVNGKTAVMSYVGKFENGTVFDASKNHGDGTFSFVLGAGMVIKGWDIGVLGMKVGESRILTIPGDLAYGPTGIPGAIPPNATLIFEVELLDIK